MEEIKPEYHKNLYKGFIDFDEYGFSYPKKNTTIRRFVVTRPDAVAILLYNKTNHKVILVKQFRAPVFVKENDGNVLEVPAGIMEKGENILETLVRETLEETGYRLNNPQFLSVFYPSVGVMNERIHLYLGVVEDSDKVEKGGGLDSEKEYLEVIEMSPEELFQLIDEGKIKDGKTMVAVFYLKKILDEKKLIS
jgi:GDP-mannose pyrophosphatase NudK